MFINFLLFCVTVIDLIFFFIFVFQKARLARIRIAKASSGAAFVNKKKAAEARIAAQASGIQMDDYKEDIFELQHHHLLRCLEKTTVNISFALILEKKKIHFIYLNQLWKIYTYTLKETYTMKDKHFHYCHTK